MASGDMTTLFAGFDFSTQQVNHKLTTTFPSYCVEQNRYIACWYKYYAL